MTSSYFRLAAWFYPAACAYIYALGRSGFAFWRGITERPGVVRAFQLATVALAVTKTATRTDEIL